MKHRVVSYSSNRGSSYASYERPVTLIPEVVPVVPVVLPLPLPLPLLDYGTHPALLEVAHFDLM
jgi:hypothetical protein